MKKRYFFAGVAGIAAGAIATKLLTRPRDVSWRDQIGLIYHPEYSWFTTVHGTRIHYQEAGPEDAPPIILIHGFISSTLVWSDVLLPLAQQGFHVVAPDLPGYGYSEKPANGFYSIRTQARVITGLMDRLGIKKATLVGGSYGGAIAATIALDHPERVERLVLVGAVTNDKPKDSLLLRLAAMPLVGDIATPLFIGSRFVLRKRMELKYQRQAQPFDERKLDARHRVLMSSDTHRAIVRTVRHWRANRIQRDARLIQQPTLLAWGDDDQHIPLSEAVRLRNTMTNARLVVFRNCGHVPHEEYPEQFVELVAGFCREGQVADSQ